MTAATARERETAQMIRLHWQERWSCERVAAHMGLSRGAVEYRLKGVGKLRTRTAAWFGPVPEVMRPHMRHAIGLARATLNRVAPPETAEYSREDWEGFCALVALRALGTYREEKGARWESWVIAKVRWEITTELRRTAPLARKRWERLEASERERLQDLGYNDAEIAARLEELSYEVFSVRYAPDERFDRAWDDPDAVSFEPSWAPEPLEWLQARAVREAIDALPAPLRQVILWRHQGYEVTEIGARLGVSMSRAGQLLADARSRLREALREWVEP